MNSSLSPRITMRRMSDDSIDLYEDIERSLHLRTLRLVQQKTLPSDVFRNKKGYDVNAQQHNCSPRPQHGIGIAKSIDQPKIHCLQKCEHSSSFRNHITLEKKTESNSRRIIENEDSRLRLGDSILHQHLVAKYRVSGSSQTRKKSEQASNRLFHQSQVFGNPPMRRANFDVHVTMDSCPEIPHRRCQSERHNRSLSIEAFKNKKSPLNQDNTILMKPRSLSQPRGNSPEQRYSTTTSSAKSSLTSKMNLSSQDIHVKSVRLVQKECRNPNVHSTAMSSRVLHYRSDIPTWKVGTRTTSPTTTTPTKCRTEGKAIRCDDVKPQRYKVEQFALDRTRMPTTIKLQTSNRQKIPNYIRCLSNNLSHRIHDDA
jgi:hypothetical protein